MIKKSSDLKKINTNLNLQHLPQWPTGGARVFNEKTTRRARGKRAARTEVWDWERKNAAEVWESKK